MKFLSILLLVVGMLVVGCEAEKPSRPVPTGCTSDEDCVLDDCKSGTCHNNGTCSYAAVNGGLCELGDGAAKGEIGVCVTGSCEDRYCEVVDDCEARPCGVPACYLNTCTWQPKIAGFPCVSNGKSGQCNGTGQCE